MADRSTSTHESFDRAAVLKGSSDRAFGLTFAVLLAVLAGITVWRGGPSWPYTLTAAVIIALIAVARPGRSGAESRDLLLSASRCLPNLTEP